MEFVVYVSENLHTRVKSLVWRNQVGKREVNIYDDWSNSRYAVKKKDLAQILLDEGYIKGFYVTEDDKQGIITIDLKYVDEQRVISGLKRISKPGRRVYVGAQDVPQVLNGLGTAVISTSKGIMTDKKARQETVGGEVICYVW